MGDYTYGQAFIYDCPPEQVGAVLDALESHGLGDQYTHRDVDYSTDSGVLNLGKAYVAEEVAGDTSEELASDLITNAPGATFETWTDPKCEWLGSYVAYTPELGQFYAECDSNGTPQFAADHIIKLFRNDELSEKVLGTPWTDVLRPLRSRFCVQVRRLDEGE